MSLYRTMFQPHFPRFQPEKARSELDTREKLVWHFSIESGLSVVQRTLYSVCDLQRLLSLFTVSNVVFYDKAIELLKASE